MVSRPVRRLFTTRLGLILVLVATLTLTSITTLHTPTRDKLVNSLSGWLVSEDLVDAPLPAAYNAYFPDGQLPVPLRRRSLAPLTERLSEFLHRPALSHEDTVAANQAACPLSTLASMTSAEQLVGPRAIWKNIDAAEIARRRAELVLFLAKHAGDGAKLLGTSINGPSKRGIVLTAGNGDTVLRVAMLLRHLRRIGSTLPVEVVHFADELTDSKYRAELESLGATLLMVHGVAKTPGMWKNYQIKAMAMIQTSFTEMIYLDSDNVPLRPMDHLFDAPVYAEGGRAAFWPDIKKDHSDNAIWRIVGETCTLKEWTFESGQIVFDKRGNGGANLAALWIAAGMLDNHEFWFGMCGGDKDTYRWAMRILDLPYAPAPRWVSALGIANELDKNKFCGHTMLQHDLVPPFPPLFVHANLLKHLQGGLSRGRVFTHVKRMAQDGYDDQSLNNVFFYVYNGPGRGMCTDILYQAGDEVGQSVLVVPVSEVPEIEGFEDAWWDAGGRVGGWS
ncbi:hypothetical protein CspeluHIS016_0702230 [Cutaneotrichosporon spelunceum]|uniref:Mannosyltransferase putative-domain-containing protein n=1 Tax=Cutaneotrichosporon spelunceum TaxID=1672016 RepID=A0AAD3TYP9_9TREE|nr:hypothetical protein CspeluHIS016_0702230 [Cutaneotrichosporon spelunceum]